jgi:DNA-binding NarL/FixJ family response regulator
LEEVQVAHRLSRAMGSIRIAVVEDSPVFRAALVSYLESQPGCVVTGTACSSAEALALPVVPAPDVVTLDLGLPDGSGLHLIGHLLEKWPDAKIVVLSIDHAVMYRDRSLAAGAHAYVNKTAAINELMPVIQSVLAEAKA